MLRAWLTLLRPANVVTALADVFAGAAVAGARSPFNTELVWLLAATACLYAGGIVLNDFFDRHLDAVERPERPIPAGHVAAGLAGAVGGGLLAAGVAAAALANATAGLVAAAVAIAVVSYDALGKQYAFIGPLNMGLCRALNLLLGVALAPPTLATAWPLALIPLAYITAVTMVSRGEVHGSRRPVALAGLGLVLASIGALVVVVALAGPAASAAPQRLWALLLVFWLAWRVVPPFARAARRPEPNVIRQAVRTGVLSLVLVGTVIAASYAGIIYSLAVLATGFLAWALARLFAVT